MFVEEPIVTEDFVETGQGRLFARLWTPVGQASRAPIVLIHDSLGCVELWRDFPAQLSKATQRRVIAYDRLGFGQSDMRFGKLQPSFVTEEAKVYIPHLLRHFRIDRFVPFGHSVGGGMAICCGASFPTVCAAIVTESAQMFAEDLTLRSIAAARIQFAETDQLDKLKKYHGEKAAWVVSAWTDTWLSSDFASWNVRTELTELRSSLLVLHGDEDEYGSLQHPETARELAGDEVATHILRGEGHVPHKTRPMLVLDLVAPFLATCP